MKNKCEGHDIVIMPKIDMTIKIDKVNSLLIVYGRVTRYEKYVICKEELVSMPKCHNVEEDTSIKFISLNLIFIFNYLCADAIEGQTSDGKIHNGIQWKKTTRGESKPCKMLRKWKEKNLQKKIYNPLKQMKNSDFFNKNLEDQAITKVLNSSNKKV